MNSDWIYFWANRTIYPWYVVIFITLYLKDLGPELRFFLYLSKSNYLNHSMDCLISLPLYSQIVVIACLSLSKNMNRNFLILAFLFSWMDENSGVVSSGFRFSFLPPTLHYLWWVVDKQWLWFSQKPSLWISLHVWDTILWFHLLFSAGTL